MKKKSSLEFWGLVLFIAFGIFAPENFFPIFGKVKAEYIVFILTFILALSRRKTPVKSSQLILIGVLAIISFLSIVTSPISSTAESYLDLVIMLKTAAIFLLVTMVVRTPADVKRLVYITIFFTLVVCIVSIYTLKEGIPPPAGSIGAFYEGRLTNHFRGVGGDPNDFAAFLLLLTPVTVCIFLEKPSVISKLSLAVVSFIFLISIAESKSRGGLISSLVVLMYLIWEYRKRVKLVIFMLILIVAVGFSAPPKFWERASALRSIDSLQTVDTAASRMVEFKNALELMKLFPVLGVGMGKYNEGKIHFLQYNPYDEGTFRVTHNAYLQTGAEIGIPGLIIFISVLLFSIKDFFYADEHLFSKEEENKLSILTKGLKIGFLGYLISIFFLSKQHSIILYQWVGLAVVLRSMTGRGEEEEAQKYED